MTFHLHFHLGPVGGFIAEARRTRDYWAGSFLLSWLIGQAMATARANGGKVILPVVQHEVPSGAENFLPAWITRLFEGKTFKVDPTLAAIEAAREGEPLKSDGPFLGTLTNHFTAAFATEEEAAKTGEESARAVRTAWKKLAGVVRRLVLDDFNFLSDPPRAQTACKIWEQQIGDADRSPFWEIYWVVAPLEQTGNAALALRKLTRWSPDMACELPEDGNFCTLFAPFVDLSGLKRRGGKNEFDKFWEKTRAQINKARYAARVPSDSPCLDLRPKESLSAPALVKRLFPLLALPRYEHELAAKIGWLPDLRNAIPVLFYKPSWLEPLRELFGDEEAETDAAVCPPAPTRLDTQSLLFWPSTSYIAATHWIARAQGRAWDSCTAYRRKLRAFAPHLAVAEQSLWLRTVHEPFPRTPPLAWIDGAMLHLNRLERVEDGDRGKREAARQALEDLHKGVGSRPPSYYAIIRADGDRVGEMLGDSALWGPVSRLFLEWAGAMRGEAGATIEDRLGPIAAHNGVLLYAGADELLAFAPAEDAFEIVCAIHASFDCKRKKIAKELKLNAIAEATVSASVLYAHIRAPLRWAIDASAKLLDEVAKDAAGRDALALALFDIDGARSRFAANWNAPQRDAFQKILDQASAGRAFLWSNEFYHRLAEALWAFLVPDRCADYLELVNYLAEKPCGGRPSKYEGRPDEGDGELVENLIRRCVAEELGVDDKPLAETLVSLLTPFDPDPKRTDQESRGHVSLAPLDVLRVLGMNWRKGEPGAAARIREPAS